MATFSCSLSNSAVVNAIKSWTISDEDVQSLIDYLVASMPRESTDVSPTPKEALLWWVQNFVDATTIKHRQWNTSHNVPPPLDFQ